MTAVPPRDSFMLSSNRSAAGRLAWRQTGDRAAAYDGKTGPPEPAHTHTHTHFIEVLAHQKSQKTSIFKITILDAGENYLAAREERIKD